MPEELPTETQEGNDTSLPDDSSDSDDSNDGYRICIDCTSEGYEVYKEDLPAGPQEEDNEDNAQPIPDLTTAIKHVLALIKENPMGNDANEQMKAGYESA